jgi:hypothetical protein
VAGDHSLGQPFVLLRRLVVGRVHWQPLKRSISSISIARRNGDLFPRRFLVRQDQGPTA